MPITKNNKAERLFDKLDKHEKKFLKRYLDYLPDSGGSEYKKLLVQSVKDGNIKERSKAFHTLLRFLKQHKNYSPRMQVHSRLNNAEILFLKHNVNDALYEIKQAENLCRRVEFWEEAVPVLEWKHKLYMNLNRYDQAKECLLSIQNALQKCRTLNGLRILETDLSARIRLPKHEKPAPAFISQAPKEAGRRLTFIFLYNQALILILQGELTPAKETLKKALHILSHNPNVRLSNPQPVMKSVLLLAELQLCLREFEDMRFTVDYLRSFRFLSPGNEAVRTQNLHLIKLLSERRPPVRSDYSVSVNPIIWLRALGLETDPEKALKLITAVPDFYERYKTDLRFIANLTLTEYYIHKKLGNDSPADSRKRSFKRKFGPMPGFSEADQKGGFLRWYYVISSENF